jgi:pentapeptide MXKDX repeat protein
MNARTLASLTLAVVIGCAGLVPAFAQDGMAGGTGHAVSHDVMDQRATHDAAPADETKDSMKKPSMEQTSMKKVSMKHGAMKREAMHGKAMKHDAMKHDAGDAMGAGH